MAKIVQVDKKRYKVCDPPAGMTGHDIMSGKRVIGHVWRDGYGKWNAAFFHYLGIGKGDRVEHALHKIPTMKEAVKWVCRGGG